jgi:hypothetical protein
MRLEFKNLSELETFISSRIKKISKKIMKEAEKDFRKKIDELNNSFLNSKDFREIKTRLVGEYGFTEGEVQALDNIVDAMSRVSKYTSSDSEFVVEYISLAELHGQPEARHTLTSAKSGGETISWTRWLEDGASVLGYTFSAKDSENSRSGKGVMSEGGAWRLRPTRAFSNLRKQLKLEDVKKILSISIKKIAKSGR